MLQTKHGQNTCTSTKQSRINHIRPQTNSNLAPKPSNYPPSAPFRPRISPLEVLFPQFPSARCPASRAPRPNTWHMTSTPRGVRLPRTCREGKRSGEIGPLRRGDLYRQRASHPGNHRRCAWIEHVETSDGM